MNDYVLKLSPEVVRALDAIARSEDVTTGQIIRDAIDRDLRRRAKARMPVRADERLVAPLRALLADDLAYSNSWPELQDRLLRKGFQLRPAGGGLALHRLRDDVRLCKSSELGYSYSRLIRRLCAPFPGHKHRVVFEKVAGEPGQSFE